jgi:hypothetical protein
MNVSQEQEEAWARRKKQIAKKEMHEFWVEQGFKSGNPTPAELEEFRKKLENDIMNKTQEQMRIDNENFSKGIYKVEQKK